MTNHYVDNKKVFQEMTDWKKECEMQKCKLIPLPPQVTEYIGECFY